MICQVSVAPGGQIIDVFNYIKKIFHFILNGCADFKEEHEETHTGDDGEWEKGKSGMKGEK